MLVWGGNWDWIGSGSLIKEKWIFIEEVESLGCVLYCFVLGIVGNGYV